MEWLLLSPRLRYGGRGHATLLQMPPLPWRRDRAIPLHPAGLWQNYVRRLGRGRVPENFLRCSNCASAGSGAALFRYEDRPGKREMEQNHTLTPRGGGEPAEQSSRDHKEMLAHIITVTKPLQPTVKTIPASLPDLAGSPPP